MLIEFKGMEVLCYSQSYALFVKNTLIPLLLYEPQKFKSQVYGVMHFERWARFI